jgi:GTP-binding protein
VSFQILLTKTDKANAAELAATREKVAAELVRHPAGHPGLMATSAVTGDGMAALRAALAALAAPPASR